MLTVVEARTNLGALLTLPFGNALNGFVVKDIEGLDPGKAVLVSSSFARQDGEQDQSARREKRNIRLHLGLEPDYINESVRTLRKRLYQFFMPKSLVSLRFHSDDEPFVDIRGRVESFETQLFTQEPGVVISIICYDPDFYDPTPVIVSGSTVSDNTAFTLNYDGTVETGIIFRLMVNRTLTEFTIYHTPPSDAIRTLEFAEPLEAGDILTISTVPGNKHATRNRAGTDTSVLRGVSPYASWIEMPPGANVFSVYAVGAAIPFEIEYTKKYGGL